ncbi:MAG: hypothetical protein K6E29_04255 [Cyanobacteria bacterium RUI128]|nr:hypothetical protein [Cyanobacteria bacterium RUI128]
MSSNNVDKQIIDNMRTHYSGLMKVGARDFGGDFMSKTIFDMVNTNKADGLTQEEIDAAMPNLDSFIAKSIEKDSFYAELHFGKSYTDAASKTDNTSDKTVSEQIIENNLNEAVEMIYTYAQQHPDDATIQKFASKLKEIKDNGKLILTNIEPAGVAGRAIKNEDGSDTLLIDNRDSMRNLTPEYLLQTLLHELRHTMETDDLNSKAEEVEAETISRELADKISGTKRYEEPLSYFEQSYNGYAEASPGTYNIPQNTGIAIWYKPEDVTMDEENNTLVIRSGAQPDLNDAVIEEHVQFGEQKDENGNPIPVSAQRVIKDKNRDVIFSMDYGEYDIRKKSFNYFKMHVEQIKLKERINPTKSFNNFGLS